MSGLIYLSSTLFYLTDKYILPDWYFLYECAEHQISRGYDFWVKTVKHA